MSFKDKMAQLILRCQASPRYFIENFCKVKHPVAGVIPFRLFKYQRTSIQAFLKHRFNLYKKNRQCGISTLSGAFALWYAMFHPHKTILIVSKRDEDAKAFLAKNVKFVYDHLPKEFKSVYGDPPKTYNEHSVEFPNGSKIQSLTSSKDTLRSNSASLNIIDEAAFMKDMDTMWAGGAPTLMMGGHVIVISTTNGVGNWYHLTWEDAKNKSNNFNPIEINWWDMDWEIPYKDPLTGESRVISPIRGLRKCVTKEDIEKWGPYYSPWLEQQYRELQTKGEAHKFRQEVLAEFLGSGNTVVSREALLHISTNISDNYRIIKEVKYIHPVSGERFDLNFDSSLWVWKPPVKKEPDIVENGKIIRPGRPGHTYVMGVDIASGEADDFSAIQVIDCDTKEQVAELNIKVVPKVLLMMIDYLGRWYNGAFVVPERTGIGIPVCHSLYNDLAYYNVYRMMSPNGKRTRKVGFPTSPTHKPTINKALMDMLGDGGVHIYSSRLFQQLSIYVHLAKRKTGAVEGAGNHDDLSIGFGLALIGMKEAVQADSTQLIPLRHSPTDSNDELNPFMNVNQQDVMAAMIDAGGMNLAMPYCSSFKTDFSALSPTEELQRFAAQLGGIPIASKLANPIMRQARNQQQINK
jgi:hypothetical protein